MPDPLISLDTDHISAQPGGQAGVTVTVTNLGTQVEGYQFQVLGPLASFSKVEPPEVSVYPQDAKTTTVVISPPSGIAVPGGLHPFGVLARSTVDTQASAVVEGDIDIGKVINLPASINPVTSSGRWRGHHVIQIGNEGNVPARLQLKAYDENAALRFYLRRPDVDLLPGDTATVGLSAGPRRPQLRGQQQPLRFLVVGEPPDTAPGPPPAAGMPGDPSRPVLQATFVQKPILSKWVITFLALLVAGIIALVTYALVRSNVKDENLLPWGSPPKPERFAATAAGSDSVKLTWARVQPADSYELLHIDPNTDDVTGVDQPEGSVTSFTVKGLPPDAEACFKLRAVANNLKGVLSEMACARTAVQPPPTTPPPTTPPPTTPPPTTPPPTTPPPTTPPPTTPPPTTPTGGVPPVDPGIMNQKWIAVLSRLPQSVTVTGAEQKVTELTDILGWEVKYLNTQDYPRLRLGGTTAAPPTEPLFLVYVGPFDTQADAESECATARKHAGDCVAAQPDPP